MDHPQVAKWQDLASQVGLPREAGGAEVRMKVSTLRPLGTIEPECGESPNGCARVCASLDSLSRMAENGQMAEDRGQWTEGGRQEAAESRGARPGQCGIFPHSTRGKEAPVENCDPI